MESVVERVCCVGADLICDSCPVSVLLFTEMVIDVQLSYRDKSVSVCVFGRWRDGDHAGYCKSSERKSGDGESCDEPSVGMTLPPDPLNGEGGSYPYYRSFNAFLMFSRTFSMSFTI